MAVVSIVQKLAEEWPGLHLCVKTPCRTAGCPAELIWPDMEGTNTTYVRAESRQVRVGAGWLLPRCWWGWSASERHVVKSAVKLAGLYVALLLAVEVHVQYGVSKYLCGQFEHGKEGENLETGARAPHDHSGQVPTCLLVHEELKVLRHLGKQQPSHQWWDLWSGWKEGASSIAWHCLPWAVLTAAPAPPSSRGFFLHRVKEDVKTCGTCGHRFGAELLLPKGEPNGSGFALQQCLGQGGRRAAGLMELRCWSCPPHPHSAQAAGAAPGAALCSLFCDKLRDHHLREQQHPGQSSGKEAAASPYPGSNTDGQTHPPLPPEMRVCSHFQPRQGTPPLWAVLWLPLSSLLYHHLTAELWVLHAVVTTLLFQNISSE